MKTKTGVIHDFNFEATKKSYSVTIEVRDSKDAAGNSNATTDDTIAVTINLTNVNEPPTIVPGASSFNKNENTATTEIIATYVASDVDADDNPGNLTWTLEGEDAGDFTIMKNSVSNDAELRFSAVPDYETPADDDDNDGNAPDNVYNVTVKVTDNGSPNLDDTLAVTITVDDVNEPPDITSSLETHTAPSFAEIEFDIADADLSATAKDVVAYTASDPDAGAALTWSVNGTDKDSFTIDNMGKLSFSIRPNFEMPDDAFTSPDTEGDNAYEIVVEVSDGLDDSGTTDTPPVVDDTIDVTVTVTVNDVDETPEITTIETSHTDPSFDEIEYDFAETPNLVIADYNGRDEGGQTITLSLTGTDAGAFAMNSTSGVLSFSTSPNYEVPTDNGIDNIYNITVKAMDTASPVNTRELDVTVTVTNVTKRRRSQREAMPLVSLKSNTMRPLRYLRSRPTPLATKRAKASSGPWVARIWAISASTAPRAIYLSPKDPITKWQTTTTRTTSTTSSSRQPTAIPPCPTPRTSLSTP